LDTALLRGKKRQYGITTKTVRYFQWFDLLFKKLEVKMQNAISEKLADVESAEYDGKLIVSSKGFII